MEFVVDRALDAGMLERYESCLRERGVGGAVPGFRRWEYGRVLRAAAFQPDDEVLETGAMHTHLCVYAATIARRVVATDNFYWAQRAYVEEQGLPSPDEWIREVEVAGEGRLTAEAADLQDLVYANASFDKVLCVSTIEHVLDDARAMREMARVLRPGGALVLTTEFNAWFGKPYAEADNSYYRIYTRAGLRGLVDASGLTLDGPVVLENRNLLRVRRKVNALMMLRKPGGVAS